MANTPAVIPVREKKAPVRLAVLALCVILFSGSAFPLESISYSYVAETVLYNEVVCPVVLPGNEDGSVIIRWLSLHNDPVNVYYAPDDGSGLPKGRWKVIRADWDFSGVFTGPIWLSVHQAELFLTPGDWVYGLAPAGELPSVLYPLRIRRGEVFRAVMSSDSHVSNIQQTSVYDETMLSAFGDDFADMVIHLGDVNDDADGDPFEIGHDSVCTRSIPTLLVPGNHDRSVVLSGYMPMPHMDPYTLDYWTIQGNVLFVGINIDLRDHAAHAQFVRETIPAHREGCDWVVVLIHYSLMSSGYHAWDQENYDLRNALAPVFQATDVDVVLSGHDHMYCRSVLVAGQELVPDSDGEQVEKRPGEAVYITLPTATGTKFYEPVPENLPPPTEQVAVEGLRYERGYVTAEFREDSIEFTAWSADTGECADHFVLTRAEMR